MTNFNFKPTLKFLSALEKNNNKAWFDKNRDEYQKCRSQWIEAVQYMLEYLGEFDPNFYQQDPRKSIFRINRDVRFSRNKKPYKAHFSAFMCHGGKKANNAGYYLHLAPENVFVAGGIYSPDKDRLFALREKISKKGDQLQKILKAKKFKSTFSHLSDNDRLIRPPQGFDKEDPQIEIMKNKHFIVREYLPESEALSPQFLDLVIGRFEILNDFIHFLNKP